MLNHKKTRCLFFTIMAICAFIVILNPAIWYVILLPTIIYLTVLVYGAISIQDNFFIDSINSFNTEKNQIALTFDDGPLEGKTDLVLDVLKRNNISATFFCIGNRIVKNPNLLKRIDLEGHIIGNHSYSHHFFFDLLSEERMIAELKQTDKLIYDQIGKRVSLFRPPYGVYNPNLANAIKKQKYVSIGWSLRTMDTNTKLEQKLVSKIASNLKRGDIVLLHDTVELTVLGLQKIIDAIRERGFEIIRLDKLLKIEPYA